MSDAAAAVESAHHELWERLVDREHGIIRDYPVPDTSLLPTVEECLGDRPNALSWGTPIENGPMFGGAYLDALCDRWRLTQSAEDHGRAALIASGLLHVARIGQTPGFIARGVSTDGVTHYAMGSNDQTLPWFYGLWRYANSGLPNVDERAEIVSRTAEVATAIRATGWRLPCDRAPFDYRSSFAKFHWEDAPRLLFVLRAVHQLTGDEEWLRLYRELAVEPNPTGGANRLDVCEAGMIHFHAPRHSWTSAASVTSLRGLWEMEDDPQLRARYAEGLRASAHLAAESLPLAEQFPNDDDTPFCADWRVMLRTWRPQQTEQEVVDLAGEQLRILGAASPRSGLEARLAREPLYAAWIVTLCSDRDLVEEFRPQVVRALQHYDYSRLYLATFFPAEAAWYRLRLEEAPDDPSR